MQNHKPDQKSTPILENKYARFFQSAPAISVLIELESGVISEVNNMFIQQLGYKADEVIGQKAYQVFQIDKLLNNNIKDTLAERQKIENYELEIGTKSGELIPVLLSAELISIDNVQYFYAVGIDISKRKKAENELLESEHRFQDLFNNMNSAFAYHKIVLDKKNKPIDYIFIDVNPNFEKLTGLKRSEIINKPVTEIMPGIDKSWIEKYGKVAITGETISFSNYSKELDKHFSVWAYCPQKFHFAVTFTDVTQQEKANILIKKQALDIKKVIQATQGKEGQDYYNSLVLCVQEISASDYTFIGAVNNDNKIETIVLCDNGQLAENVVYELEQSPCENVFGKKTCVYKSNLINQFPNDQMLAELGIQAYIGTPIFDKSGTSLGIVVALFKHEITDTAFIEALFELFATSIGNELVRSKSALALMESKQRYKWLSEATFEGIIITKNGKIIDANTQIQKIYGYNSNDISSIFFGKFFHPDDYQMVAKRIKENDTSSYQYRGITKDGKIIYLDVHVRNIDMNGELYRLAVLRDITKQKKQEQELQEREQMLSVVFDNTPAIMMLLNDATEIEQMNKFGQSYVEGRHKKMKGLKCGEALGCIGAGYDKSGFRDSKICKNCVVRNATENTLATGVEHLKLEADLIISKNTDLVIKTFLTTTNLININGKRQVLLTLDDITERKQIEEELVMSNEAAIYNENRYKLLTDLTFEGIVLHRDSKILNVNKSFENMSGFIAGELVGFNFFEKLLPQKYHSMVQSKLGEEYSSPYEVELKRKDGSLYPAEIEARYFKQMNNKVRVAAIRDISERKLLEKKVLNAILETEERERAHFAQELHDGLGPIMSNVQMYFQWLAEADENREFVTKKGNKSLQDAFQTLREISSKLSPHILHNFGLSRALHSFIEQVPSMSSLNIIFDNNIEETRYNPNVEITLYRVLTELINNTIKYAKANVIRIKINHLDNYLQIHYQDDGKGFDIMEKVDDAKGFGLFNIQSRIKTLFGEIEYLSTKGQGLKVSIRIPIDN